jgi:hypothetical protein
VRFVSLVYLQLDLELRKVLWQHVGGGEEEEVFLPTHPPRAVQQPIQRLLVAHLQEYVSIRQHTSAYVSIRQRIQRLLVAHLYVGIGSSKVCVAAVS